MYVHMYRMYYDIVCMYVMYV